MTAINPPGQVSIPRIAVTPGEPAGVGPDLCARLHAGLPDAELGMYHDQGLPVLKHMGFGRTVNITLGQPIVRTSVDHGTALDLAGTGRADFGSMRAALEVAIRLGRRNSQPAG